MSSLPSPRAQSLVTGTEYVRQITARRGDRRARDAFRQLALQLAPPGATVFDFGCGTGLDAAFYAERGRSVVAYDVDAAMCQHFAGYCAPHIASGRVRLESGPYAEFIARHRGQAGWHADLVTANFAPLNLVSDLRELCAALRQISRPGGRLLASVLNPFYCGDLKYAWWWRNLGALLRRGHYALPGAQAPIHRRRVADFAASCAPHFLLEQVLAGSPSRGGQLRAGAPRRDGRYVTCRFLFLVFIRAQTDVDPPVR
jgi:SAM-dependent methyltransferase